MRWIRWIHIALVIMMSFLMNLSGYSQCTQLSKESINELNGLNSLLIKDYFVRIKAGDLKHPVRTKRVEVFLEADIKYMFKIYHSDKVGKEAVLQLYDHRELLGTSYKQSNSEFEFVSNESKNYQLVFSGKSGKKVCANASLSMVLEDSTKIFDTRIGDLMNSSMEILYPGIDNLIEIAASGVKGGYLEVSISKGMITGEKGIYYVKVDELGITNVKVRSFNKDSILHEESNTPFLVAELPKPKIIIGGISEGNISRQIIQQTEEVELSFHTSFTQKSYEITEFSISKNISDLNVYKSIGNRFSNRQKNFLAGLIKGDEFYLKRILVRSSDGKKLILEPVKYIVN